MDKIKNTIKFDDNSLKDDDNFYEMRDNQPDEKEEQKQKSDFTLNSNVDFNFNYLDDLIHSNKTEIFLESNIVLQDSEFSKYFDGISINDKNIIIDGKNHFIDAKNKVRILNIYDCDITFKNITFKNASFEKKIHDSDGNCGAIHIDNANIFFENCKFLNNQSKEDYASVIYNYHSTLTFYKCQFKFV